MPSRLPPELLTELPSFVDEDLFSQLRDEALSIEQRFARPQLKGEGLLGWALQSASGEVFDGFRGWEYLRGDKTQNANGQNFSLRQAAREGYRVDYLHDQTTPACTGPFLQLLEKMKALGLHPRRARLSILPPAFRVPTHVDGAKNEYFVRFHLPLFTVPEATLSIRGHTTHLPAHGHAYLFSATEPHSIENTGHAPRLHFLATVWDTRPLSRHFACSVEQFAQAQNNARKYSRVVEAVGDS